MSGSSNATLLGLSVESCPNGAWDDALFLRRSDKPPSFFANISSWDKEDYTQWLVNDLAVSWIPSCVFLGIALVSGLAFIAWRLVFCTCCMGCYVLPCGCSKQKREQRAFQQNSNSKQQQHRQGEVMHPTLGEEGAYAAPAAEGADHQPLPRGALYMVPDPQDIHRQYKQQQQQQYYGDVWAGAPRPSAGRYAGAPGDASCYGKASAIKAVMFVVTLLALGAAGVTIWGMTQMHKGLSSEGWDAVANITLYVVDISGSIQRLINNASYIVPAVTYVQYVANATLKLQNMTAASEQLSAWLNDPNLPPGRVTNTTTTLLNEFNVFTVASLTLEAGLPTLTQQMSALQPPSTRVGATGAQQVNSTGAALSGLFQQLSSMPQQPNSTAASALQASIAQLDAAQRQADMAQLAKDLAALQASISNQWRPAHNTTLLLGGDNSTANATAAAGLPSVNQVTAAALVTNASVVRGQASLQAFQSSVKEYASRYSSNSSLLTRLVNYLEGIQTNLVLLPPDATGAYNKLDTLDAYTTAIATANELEFNRSLANVLVQLGASIPTVSSLATSLAPLNGSLAALPSYALLGNLTLSANSTSAALGTLQPPLATTSSALSAYLASPTATTYQQLLATLNASSNATEQALAALTPLYDAATAAPNSTTPGAGLWNASAALAATLAATNVTQAQVNATVQAIDNINAAQQAVRPQELFHSLSALGLSFNEVLNSWPPPRSAVLSSLTELVQFVNSVVNDGGTAAISALNSSLVGANDTFGAIQTSVIDQLNNMRADLYEPTTTIDKARYIGGMVIYAVCLLELVLLLLAMFLRWPALFTLTLTLISVLVVLYFILAFAIAWALAGGNDACPGAEQIAISFVGAKSQPVAALAQYYFFNVGGTLSQVLYDNGFVSIQDINQTVTQLTDSVVTNLTSRGLTPVGDFNASLVLTNLTIFATLASQNYLVNTLSYNTFNPVYVTTKAFFCCGIPDEVYNVWIACTFAGWAMMVMCWLGYYLVSVHDRLPGAHQRCGCTCLAVPPSKTRCCGKTSASGPAQQQPIPVDAIAVGVLPGAAGGALGHSDELSHSSPETSELGRGGQHHSTTAIINPLGGRSTSGSTPDKPGAGLAGNYQPASAASRHNTSSVAYGSAMGGL